MEYVITQITERVNSIVNKYITKDKSKNHIEKQGYLRRSNTFPERYRENSTNVTAWKLAAEVPPDYLSTTGIDLYYRWTSTNPRLHEFEILGERVEGDLEIVLAEFDTKLKELKTRINR